MRRTGMMRSQRSIVLARLAVTAGLAGSLVVGGSTAASASCGPLPPPSPDAFVGTVVDTDLDDRRATVETTDGDTVTVVGTPSPRPNTFSSVDRSYDVGATYEFHPVNGADPYEDNACTRTHQLRGDAIPAELRGAPTEAPSPQVPDSGGPGPTGAIDGATDSSLPGGSVALFGLLGVAVVALGASWLWLQRRPAIR
jgi:hypothetical protein